MTAYPREHRLLTVLRHRGSDQLRRERTELEHSASTAYKPAANHECMYVQKQYTHVQELDRKKKMVEPIFTEGSLCVQKLSPRLLKQCLSSLISLVRRPHLGRRLGVDGTIPLRMRHAGVESVVHENLVGITSARGGSGSR